MRGISNNEWEDLCRFVKVLFGQKSANLSEECSGPTDKFLKFVPENNNAASFSLHADQGSPWIDVSFGNIFTEIDLGGNFREEVAKIATSVINGSYCEEVWKFGPFELKVAGFIDVDGVRVGYFRTHVAYFLFRPWSKVNKIKYGPY